MKDYRIKEVVRKKGSYFQIQTYNPPLGWDDAGHRHCGGAYIHLTLKEAQAHIQNIRDRRTTDIKYHY